MPWTYGICAPLGIQSRVLFCWWLITWAVCFHLFFFFGYQNSLFTNGSSRKWKTWFHFSLQLEQVQTLFSCSTSRQRTAVTAISIQNSPCWSSYQVPLAQLNSCKQWHTPSVWRHLNLQLLLPRKVPLPPGSETERMRDSLPLLLNLGPCESKRHREKASKSWATFRKSYG